MPNLRKPMAASRRTAAGPVAALLAFAAVAWCNPARAGSECADHAHGPDAAAASAATAPFASFDPATFVGPPAPLGILFAPAMAPAAAGLRYQLEAPPAAATTALRPAPGGGIRMVWDSEVHSQLREVAAPGGGYMIDLLGAYLDLATITIGEDGRPVLECVQQRRTAGQPAARTAARARAGRE